MTEPPKRPRDPNQLAKLITDIATGEVAERSPDGGKDPAAVADIAKLVEDQEAEAASRTRGPYKERAE